MRIFSVALVSSVALFGPEPAFAGLRCESVFGNTKIETWQDALRVLSNATDQRLKQPFEVRARAANGKPISAPHRAGDYGQAKFVISRSPIEIPEGATVLQNAVFGYDLGNFRQLGPLQYLVVDRQGRVLEVGGGSKELLAEFRHHVMGRTLTREELKTINEINRKLLAELRQSPASQQKLAEFSKKRGWPTGLEVENQLAYFSEDIIPIKEWALKNGYTLEQMRDAGWMLMKFNNDGSPKFVTNSDDSIKIPFFGDPLQQTIPVWRSRAMKTKPGEPKYRGWQMDRALDRDYSVAETLFNGWNLKKAEGQTIVITEGEFKCMVAQKATGLLTVGIPGISQFDAKIGAAILAAHPKEIIVVLDRDPKGKGLMRVDEITDSQRAAYSIAQQLRELGGSNVKIGVLPDVFEGGKVGIDDLILGKGTEPYLQTLENAMSPEQYAKDIGLDTTLHEAYRRRQALRKSLESQQLASDRGNGDITAAEEAKAREFSSQLDQQFDLLMRQRYAGARQYNRPTTRFPFIPPSRTQNQFGRGNFGENILIMDYVPQGLAKEARCSAGPCAEFEMNRAEIEKILSGKLSQDLLAKGREIAKAAKYDPRSFDDQAQLLLAAKLSHDFPPDDYDITFGTPFISGDRTPILISKKGEGTVVAMARLRMDDVTNAQTGSLFSRIWRQLRPGN